MLCGWKRFKEVIASALPPRHTALMVVHLYDPETSEWKNTWKRVDYRTSVQEADFLPTKSYPYQPASSQPEQWPTTQVISGRDEIDTRMQNHPHGKTTDHLHATAKCIRYIQHV